MTTLRHIASFSAFYAFLILLGACSWTPRVETSIHEGPQGSVSLITVTEESFEADHPVTLQTETIEHILRGLQIRQGHRLLQKIVAGEATPQHVYTEEQISALAPHVQKAFSQVTPEEHITIHTPGNEQTIIRDVKSTMYIKGNDLYASLTFGAHSSHTSTKSVGKGIRPDQEGRGSPSIAFSPKEALHKKKKPHWLFGGEEENYVVINLLLLASLHGQHSIDPLKTEQTISQPAPLPSPEIKNQIDKGPDGEGQKRASPQPHPSPQVQDTDNTQRLMEEIKALREELAEQKKEIEQLKE